MSLYHRAKGGGTLSPAICGRCSLRVGYDDLVEDPNTRLRVCPACRDNLDPYRLPPRRPENIALRHPRPDEDLV